jgi:hypothetical protein
MEIDMDHDTLMRRWRDLLSRDPELREHVARLDGDARRRGEHWNWQPYFLALLDAPSAITAKAA